MTSPTLFLRDVIDDGLEFLTILGGPRSNDEVRRFLLAIALQESGPTLEARYQSSPSTTPGPARGWWQFESGGGVAGVLRHSATKDLAEKACKSCIVVHQQQAVWRALEGHDKLAVAFARLLVLTYPGALPKTQQGGWDQYINLWRPGKPHQASWSGNWVTASDAVQANPVSVGAGV